MELHHDEILHELHGQLKAASRIVQNLKYRVEELTNQNNSLSQSESDLQRRSSSQEKIIQDLRCHQSALMEEVEKLRKSSESNEHSVSDSSMGETAENGMGIDLAKIKKLAQEQMAKLIARHRSELQEWRSRYKALEDTFRRSQVIIVFTSDSGI